MLFIFQAPSKDVVHRLCNEAFLYRHNIKKPNEVVQAAAENLSIELQEAQGVYYDCRFVIFICLFFHDMLDPWGGGWGGGGEIMCVYVNPYICIEPLRNYNIQLNATFVTCWEELAYCRFLNFREFCKCPSVSKHKSHEI